ncbi:anthranilate phosphoribosyltransferase [Aestuariibacter salexigens]|uniref:anthranilate phosphoribosyltransferase n=1 Tax=Aestuariibacter salexigens TaxID=226010 RepID=UPI0003F55123|nr:anthranilate phosphoribosyltransferase [Aestuariibacter salexigens]
MSDVHPSLEVLYQQQPLSQAQAQALFTQVMRGELEPVLLASLLIALKMKGETPDEIAGAAAAMVNEATAFPRPDYAFADIVGTGGDGHNTINISSAAAIVVASCGVPVAKHGNRSVSSKSGSADLFAMFDMKLDMSPETARRCLDKSKFCFLFAPVYHPGVRHAMPVRGALKTRTLFNILGPLANPSKPSHSMLGVYRPELLKPYAQTLKLLGHKRAVVVHGSGLDELALHGPSDIVELDNGVINQLQISPSDFGLKEYKLDELAGGDPQHNHMLITEVLSGKGKAAHEAAIAMNAGLLLLLCGAARDLKQAADIAREAMHTGRALATIRSAATLSQEGL